MESGLLAGDVVAGVKNWHSPVILLELMSAGLRAIDGRLGTKNEEHWRALDHDGSLRIYIVGEESFGRIVPLNRSIESVLADM